MRPLAPALCLFLAACNPLTAIESPSLDGLEPTALARVELGRGLFFDPGLSGVGDTSCATCHAPDHFGAEPLPVSIGTQGAQGRRNAPSVLNAALKDLQFWDGRADTLEEQALGPLFAADEMGADEATVLAYLDGAWADEFAAAFPGQAGPTLDQLATALADYQRVLPSPSRFDRYLSGERDALNAQEIEGLASFRNNCAFCHGGDGVGGDELALLGEDVPWPEDRRADLGRAEVTGDPADELWFVVPSLRNVTRTPPYFHDGSVETLREAVELMGRHQLDTTFSEDELQALLAFLGTLEAEELPPWAFAPDPDLRDRGRRTPR